MTLILAAIDGYFIAISDLLETRQGKHPERQAILPLFQRAQNLVVNDATITGVCQKTMVLGGQHVISISGDAVLCDRVVSRLYDSIRLGWNDRIEDIIRSLEFSDEEIAACTVIHHWIAENGHLFHEWHQAKEAEIEGQHVIFAGSGDRHFVDGIQPDLSERLTDPTLRHIMPWIHRVAAAVWDELWDRGTYADRYGGWFEIVFFADNVFKKIPYAIKLWRHAEGDIFNLPLFSSWYVDEHLIISRLGNPADADDYSASFLAVKDPLNRTPVGDLSWALDHFQPPGFIINIAFDEGGDFVVLPVDARQKEIWVDRTDTGLRYEFRGTLIEHIRAAFREGPDGRIYRPLS